MNLSWLRYASIIVFLGIFMAVVFPAVASADIVQTVTGWGTMTTISSSGAIAWSGDSRIVIPPPSNFGNPGNRHVVGFDNLADSVSVTNQYQASDRVVFSLIGSNSANCALAAADATVRGLLAGDDSISEPSTLAAWNTTFSGPAPTVKIAFVPGAGELLPTAAGLVFADSPPSDVFTLRAYNAQGTVVATITSDTADTLYNTPGPIPHAEDHFLGFTYAGGISYLTYTMALNTNGGLIGSEIDNVTFDISVAPEPATVALLGLGGLALIRRRIWQRLKK
jgi:hypothetical protein